LKEYNNVSLHFANHESSGSPLSEENMEKRKSELKELLRRLKKEPYGETANFRMYSWLNSFAPFSRLLPPEFFHNAPVKDYYASEAVWGQFLDRKANLRENMVNEFLQCINKATSKESLYDCFPYKATEAIAPIKVLYKHFGLI